jgi:hypothetical protein
MVAREAAGGAVARGDFRWTSAHPTADAQLGPCPVGPKRNTSRPHPEHKAYTYLLRARTIDKSNLGHLRTLRTFRCAEISESGRAHRLVDKASPGVMPVRTP